MDFEKIFLRREDFSSNDATNKAETKSMEDMMKMIKPSWSFFAAAAAVLLFVALTAQSGMLL